VKDFLRQYPKSKTLSKEADMIYDNKEILFFGELQ
jgi:hypothetical protein